MTEPKLDLERIRTDYQKGALSETGAGNDPIVFLKKWLQEAITAKVMEVNAMALSTLDKNGQLHSRIVLLKDLEADGLHFFTNYDSAKGRQIAHHAQVAALFFWKELERQVRVEGSVEKLTPEASDAYFNIRPLGSRISAIASPQSRVIADRKALEDKVKTLENQAPKTIQRPKNWGGYRIVPNYIEFWQGRHSRLHDRIAFEKSNDGNWKKYRLAP